MVARYLDPQAGVEDRVQDLLEQMTLAEKVAQLSGVWLGSLVQDGSVDAASVLSSIPLGAGEVTRIGGSTGLEPHESARLFNDIQTVVVNRTRLGVPLLVHEEAVGGYSARGATVFPQAIALASTWQPGLVKDVADVVRAQMMAVGARHALAPVLDVARDPRWGRTEETYGEDPYLCSVMGMAFVKGLQTDDLRYGVLATGKHFVGHGASEGGRNHANVQMGWRELREVHARPFAAAITQGGLACVMNAYSAVDGVPCAASKELLDGLLRGELGFAGFVTADYFAIDLLINYHRTAKDKVGAGAAALTAGIDLELPAADCYAEPLLEAVETGLVPREFIDRSVSRVLSAKVRLGLFERPYAPCPPARLVLDGERERVTARAAAREAVILLWNDGILPLPADTKRLAVIGPAADDRRLLQGDYHYPAHQELLYDVTEKKAEGANVFPAGLGAFNPGPFYTHHVTLLEGLRNAVGTRVEVSFAQGCSLDGPAEPEALDEAAGRARDADVAIVVLGDKSGLTPSASVGEARDTADLRLGRSQRELLTAVVATGTPVVVVILSGRVHSLQDVTTATAAGMLAWPLGEEGGNALADVLLGHADPGGRLPVSIPRSVGQVPVYTGHRSGASRSMFYNDYVDELAGAQFSLGYGLSYTTFSYSDFRLKCGTTRDPIVASAVVTNTGDREGTEVPQLYCRLTAASVSRPEASLLGFTKVMLPPGSSVEVEFEVEPAALAYYDEGRRVVLEPAYVEVWVGSNSQDSQRSIGTWLTGETVEFAALGTSPTQVTSRVIGKI